MTTDIITNRFSGIKKLHVAIGVIFAISTIVSVLVAYNAFAAVGRSMVRFDRMKTSTATTGMVCFTPATTSSDVKTWTVTFPAGFTVSGTAANWQTANISTSNLPAGATAWPNATSATASVSTQTVTWTNSAAQTMNSGTQYCYNWTSTAAITTASGANPNLTGTVATQNTATATIDNSSYATATIADDQIQVTATVPALFSFALSGNSDPLGTLTTGGVATSATPVTATVNTNAKNGWTVWARDANTGLLSTSAAKTIASTTPGSNSTLVAGTEGYNMGVASTQAGGSGTITVQTPFVYAATLGRGGGLNTTLAPIAISTGTADTAVLTLRNNVAINPTTPAATDYADTITVIGAGLF